MRKLIGCVALSFAATGAHAQAAVDGLGEAQGLPPSAPVDDELGEAQGLPPSGPARPVEGGSEDLRWRAHGLVDWRFRQTPRRDGTEEDGPNAEIGATLDAALPEALAVFAEGRALYEAEVAPGDEHVAGTLDQGGVRWRPRDHLSFAVGKERSRRSPGLMVSPADILHTAQNAPGLREERGGVWLARASWQTERQTVDLLALDGAIEPDEPGGVALRYFRRMSSGWDLGLDVGSLDDEPKAGAFVQTIAWQVWKVYAEAGYDGATATRSQLVGVGYEGSSDYALRAEWYGKDRETTRRPGGGLDMSTLFHGKSYATVSASALELRDRFTLTETFVKSLEDGTYGNLFRLDCLIGDRHVAGATLIHAGLGGMEQRQLIVDWKTSL
jgi:hypothetical protein